MTTPPPAVMLGSLGMMQGTGFWPPIKKPHSSLFLRQVRLLHLNEALSMKNRTLSPCERRVYDMLWM